MAVYLIYVRLEFECYIHTTSLDAKYECIIVSTILTKVPGALLLDYLCIGFKVSGIAINKTW